MEPSGDGDLQAHIGDLELPLPAVVVVDGIVVVATPDALATSPRAALGVPLASWFRADAAGVVERALRDGSGRYPPVVAAADRDRWIALHVRPPAGHEQRWLVVLRDATDERMTGAALDAVADSTFVIDHAGGNRWRSARLRERSAVPDDVAASTPAGTRIHPEDLPLVFETFASVSPDAPATVVARSRAVDDDDRWEWIEMTVWHHIAHDVLRGYLVQVRNLDAGRTLETALSQADPELLSLTDAAPVGIAVTDPAGQIVYRNPAAQRLLGPEIRSFGDGDWVALAIPEHRAELAQAFHAALREGQEATVTAAFERADGRQPRWLRMQVRTQRDGTDRPTGVITTIEDVTDQIEARAELQAAEERMRHLATHDNLTGLPNRAALTEELSRAMHRQGRNPTGLALLFCDLDGFKPINDRLGHAAGDAVLTEVARRLRRVVREADFAARLGGDEFVVLCEGSGPTTATVDELAERIHHEVEAPIGLGDEEVTVGVSIGVALLEPGGTYPDDGLLVLADQAMYDAKAAGRGRTCVCWTHRPEVSTAS